MKTVKHACAQRTASLEMFKPAKVPSWFRRVRWQSLAWCPAPGADSKLRPAPPCPRPTTSSLLHATQEHWTSPNPHPITRGHRQRQTKVTGTETRERELRHKQISTSMFALRKLWLCIVPVQVWRLETWAEGWKGKKSKCRAGVWYRTHQVHSFRTVCGNSEWSNFSAGFSFSTCHDYSGW